MLYPYGWSSLTFRIYPKDLNTGAKFIHNLNFNTRNLNFNTRNVNKIMTKIRERLIPVSNNILYTIEDFMVFFVVFTHIPILIKMYKMV